MRKIGVERKDKGSGQEMLICPVLAEAMRCKEPQCYQVKPIDSDPDFDP